MDAAKLNRAARPAALGRYLKKAAGAAGHEGHAHGGETASVRTAEHNGHRITLTTTYRVEVNGRVLDIPLMVDDAGVVHCHSLPNYQFDSALEMIKAAIDLFPDEFPPAKQSKAPKAGHSPSLTGGRKKRSGRAKP